VKHFFDSSLLVAAFDDEDTEHESAQAAFMRHAGSAAMATHSMAETFSVLTGRRGWRASDAFEIIRANTALLQKMTLSPSALLSVLEQAEEQGIRGGAVYDALILAAARKAKAETIWTLDVHHFQLFAPDLRERIRSPGGNA
jgi:predicted nucleic acid-binding protein